MEGELLDHTHIITQMQYLLLLSATFKRDLYCAENTARTTSRPKGKVSL